MQYSGRQTAVRVFECVIVEFFVIKDWFHQVAITPNSIVSSSLYAISADLEIEIEIEIEHEHEHEHERGSWMETQGETPMILWLGAVPALYGGHRVQSIIGVSPVSSPSISGTSCQATIMQSLRDISQQAQNS